MSSENISLFSLELARDNSIDTISTVSCATGVKRWNIDEPIPLEGTFYNRFVSNPTLRDRFYACTSQFANNVQNAPKRLKILVLISMVFFLASIMTIVVTGILLVGANIAKSKLVQMGGESVSISPSLIIHQSNPSEVPTLTPSKLTNHYKISLLPSVEPYIPAASLYLSSKPTIEPSLYKISDPATKPAHNTMNVPRNRLSNAPTTDKTKTLSPNSIKILSQNFSKTPTKHPIFIPSQNPTNSPSHDPTNSPSQNPSISPSYSPTKTPSQNPSISPSYYPTNTPSQHLTENPSARPTYIQSTTPSKELSDLPSLNPTPIRLKATPSLVFYVMGGIPFTKEDVKIMNRQIKNLPQDGSFLMHVGDINDVTDNGCENSVFEQTKEILQSSTTPVFIVPGDNDWNLCPDPDDAMNRWLSSFKSFEDQWNHKLIVERSSQKPIFFSFVESKVLVLGIHLTGPPIIDLDQWRVMMLDNTKWVVRKVQKYRAGIESIVILGHANPNSDIHSLFTESVSEACNIWKIPILYIHGGGKQYYEKWGSEVTSFDCEYITDVQVDMGRLAPPLQVSVDLSNPKHFSFNRRLTV